MSIVTGAMDGGKKHKGLDGIPITPTIGDMTSDHEFNEFMSVMKDENTSVMKDENTTPSGGLTTKTKVTLLLLLLSNHIQCMMYRPQACYFSFLFVRSNRKIC